MCIRSLSGASLTIPDGSRSDAALNIMVGSRKWPTHTWGISLPLLTVHIYPVPLAVALTFGTQAVRLTSQCTTTM